MFGDYYTADLVSASTQTNMIGNQIDEFMRQGSEKVTGAALTLLLVAAPARADVLLPAHDPPGGRRGGRRHEPAAQSLGPAALPGADHRRSTSSGRCCRSLLAIAFAFNNGRSRTTWQGFSFRWFTGETGSVLHDPALRDALEHTLLLAVICVAVATPLGVALALGLQRWRGRGSGTRQHADAAAARDARRS